MKKFLIAIMLMLPVSTIAQQPAVQPDPAFLQKAIVTLQSQRNTALDAQAVSEARASMLNEQLESANKTIEALRKQAADKDKPVADDKVNKPAENK